VVSSLVTERDRKEKVNKTKTDERKRERERKGERVKIGPENAFDIRLGEAVSTRTVGQRIRHVVRLHSSARSICEEREPFKRSRFHFLPVPLQGGFEEAQNDDGCQTTGRQAVRRSSLFEVRQRCL